MDSSVAKKNNTPSPAVNSSDDSGFNVIELLDNMPIKERSPSSNSSGVGGPPKQIRKPVMVPPFQTILFNLSDSNFKCLVLDNFCLEYGYVGCFAKKHIDQFAKIQKYFSMYEDNRQSYKPKLEEYCLARYNNEWHRAKVVDIKDDTFTVADVDFTNEICMTCTDIRRYPADLTLDCYTNLCLIDGLPSRLNEEQMVFLRAEININKLITISCVKEIEDQIVTIEITDLIQRMHEKKLI